MSSTSLASESALLLAEVAGLLLTSLEKEL